MNQNKIYTLVDRGIIYINGEDSFQFLQNILTNDVSKITGNNSCFSSLLTPQGKYLFDFIIVKHKKGFFIDCEKGQIEELLKQLLLYRLRSKVEILNLSNEFVVAALDKEKFLSFKDTKDQAGYTIRLNEDPLFLDPRNKKLGARLIINSEKLILSIEKLKLVASDHQEYYNLSYKLGIPQIGTDKLKNKIFGIECNFEELNGIDFKKGCYVGQENTSRIKLRNKLSKRLFSIKIVEGKANIDEDIKIGDEVIGKILIGEQNPFALIKCKVENFDFSKEYFSKSAKIKILKPDWM